MSLSLTVAWIELRRCLDVGSFRQEFDSRATLERLNQPAYRGPAASVVNIHPLAKTFEGLVPVSLDAPPPRPKRMGKQVGFRPRVLRHAFFSLPVSFISTYSSLSSSITTCFRGTEPQGQYNACCNCCVFLQRNSNNGVLNAEAQPPPSRSLLRWKDEISCLHPENNTRLSLCCGLRCGLDVVNEGEQGSSFSGGRRANNRARLTFRRCGASSLLNCAGNWH